MHSGLYCGPADARESRNLFDREIANPAPLDLESNDAEDGALAFRIVLPQIVRHTAGSTEHSAPVSRSLSVGRPLALPRGKPTENATVDPPDLCCVAGSRPAT
jgi:hypothetical protein